MKLDLGTGDDDSSNDDDSDNENDEATITEKPQASNEEQMDTSESPTAELQNGETSILNDEDIAWPMGAAHVGEDCVAFSTKVRV